MTDRSNDEPTGAAQPRKRRPSTAQAIGGVLAGFDYQVFRASKPAAELVEHAAPVRGVSGEDGTLLELEFPDDEPSTTTSDADDPAHDDGRSG